ncbi:hypothetical protein X777_03737 [Ooceraea biroi]|uniref:Uncharacterized protein n=1 Tax=Ooceraea biroi TaxID=2015173 RepID=A0A026WJ71_OOCBI|nr:hypothetical protein X777_03737 [Ooceraea biroi]
MHLICLGIMRKLIYLWLDGEILSSKDLNEYVTYAQDLILFFIKTFMKLYGIHNMSHNIHNLIHLVDDVKKFGPLDNFSAFKFENYMQILKKYIRKADRPLQQLYGDILKKKELTQIHQLFYHILFWYIQI